MMRLSGKQWGEQERKKKGRGKETEKLKLGKGKQRAVLKENLNLASGHHIAQVPVSSFPQEMTASISVELFA